MDSLDSMHQTQPLRRWILILNSKPAGADIIWFRHSPKWRNQRKSKRNIRV